MNTGNNKKEHTTWVMGVASVTMLFITFMLVCMVVITMGLKVYKKVVTDSNDNFELRTSLDYVKTKIRNSDTAGLTRVEEIDGVGVLKIGEMIEGSWYDTIIYYYDGSLREQFCEKDAYFDLSMGMPSFDIADFRMQELEKGVITLTAVNNAGDTETLNVVLRTD